MTPDPHAYRYNTLDRTDLRNMVIGAAIILIGIVVLFLPLIF